MRDPEASLVDIVVYSRRALGYLEDVSAREFAHDTGIQDQVIRCLTVIGEAARRTPDAVRCGYPQVPWTQIIGMRNRLAHEYDGIDTDTVWVTVRRDLPRILAELECGLAEASGGVCGEAGSP